MTDLYLKGISKNFGATPALQGLDLEISSGEFLVLLGPSGAGKTTTLRVAAGLESPDAGRVWLNGEDVTMVAPALRDMAFVFQQYSLYPHLSVYDNLAFPLRSPMRQIREDDISKKISEVAAILHLEDKLQSSATRLSGGQMQRVAIGRALVRSPAVYLMDEPLSSLDAKLRNDLRLELKQIQQTMGATMLYVTHDQVEALTLADRIGVLDQGRLVQLATPREIYENPQTLSVASRLGSPRINLLSPRLLPGLNVTETAHTIGVRPEHIRLSDGHSTNASQTFGRIARVERLSDQYLVHVSLDGSDEEMIALTSAEQLFSSGAKVGIEVKQFFSFDRHEQRID